MLLFATPALCQSRVCGPVVDVAEQVKRDRPDDAAYIHMEIYDDNDPNKGARAQVARLQPADRALAVRDRRRRQGLDPDRGRVQRRRARTRRSTRSTSSRAVSSAVAVQLAHLTPGARARPSPGPDRRRGSAARPGSCARGRSSRACRRRARGWSGRRRSSARSPSASGSSALEPGVRLHLDRVLRRRPSAPRTGSRRRSARRSRAGAGSSPRGGRSPGRRPAPPGEQVGDGRADEGRAGAVLEPVRDHLGDARAAVSSGVSPRTASASSRARVRRRGAGRTASRNSPAAAR